MTVEEIIEALRDMRKPRAAKRPPWDEPHRYRTMAQVIAEEPQWAADVAEYREWLRKTWERRK